MAYPDKINALVDVTADQTLAAGGHAARHNDVNDALEEVRDLLNGGSAGEVLIAAGSSAAPTWGAGGKILQIVRATDGTDRSTTSGTLVDASLSVTITPQKNDSAILLEYFAVALHERASVNNGAFIVITDNSNNILSGAESSAFGVDNVTTPGTQGFRLYVAMRAYSTPATTSATTYKVRCRAGGGTLSLLNSQRTGQLYAMEISA